jgi:16S rRNA (guanine966-N2)-methyltransferase
MRIIGGHYRGKKLISPSSLAIRPTSDRVREALFNILRAKLGNDFSSMNLLDVFTGSGAFG